MNLCSLLLPIFEKVINSFVYIYILNVITHVLNKNCNKLLHKSLSHYVPSVKVKLRLAGGVSRVSLLLGVKVFTSAEAWRIEGKALG